MMFRQHPAPFLPPFRPVLLVVAVAGGAGMALGVGWSVAWVLNAVGWLPVPPPVEVSYTPYDDGRTLEDILGETAERERAGEDPAPAGNEPEGPSPASGQAGVAQDR